MNKFKITLIFIIIIRLLNYDFILMIPKIKLLKYININETLDDGIKVDIKRAKIISGHSGYGVNSHFNDLVDLKIGDKIIFKDNKYNIYEVFFIKKITKGSKIIIDNDEKYLYLITCDINDLEKKQVIIGSKLVKMIKK